MSEFGSLDLDEVMGEDARLNEGTNNFLDQFVPMPEVKAGQTGSVAIRILPPAKGGKLYQYNRTHKINERSVHCPRPLNNGKWDRNVSCPICDYYANLWKQIEKLEKAGKGAEADVLKDEARQLKPVERYYYNAIVRSMTVEGKEVKNAGPRILSVGKILHKMIIRAIVGDESDPDSKLGNITDLKNGWDFIIRKEVTSGSEGFPKYDRSGFARQQSPAGDPEEIKKWQESLCDLTKLRNPKDVEYLEKELAIHRGFISDEVEQSSYNEEKFRSKWQVASAEEVSTTSTSVSVPENIVSETSTETVESSASSVSIEDEDFMKELESMG